MNKTVNIVGVAVISWAFFAASNSNFGLTNDELNTIINETNASFDLAEQKILGSKPDIPDDTPVGPHPDKDKCICRGTGVITHGDGHTTDCPYHSKGQQIESGAVETVPGVSRKRSVRRGFFRRRR